MKKKLLVCLMSVILLSTVESYAGFIKKNTTAAQQTEQPATNENAPMMSNEAATPVHEAMPVAETKQTTKKHSFFSRLVHKVATAKAEISQALYIVLAIIGFGWLAMGVNDNFQGSDWLISLVLYILFWLPGFIYTLIKMKKYYK